MTFSRTSFALRYRWLASRYNVDAQVPQSVKLVVLLVKTLAMLGCSGAHPQALKAPPGEMIDVGNHALHFNVTPGDGTAAIVLEAGGGAFSSSWHYVQRPLAKRTGATVISYDRAGLGWSQASTATYDVRADAEALHKGLARLGLHRGIVLVAASYGAFVTQMYAAMYPEEVAGLVLVEPNTSEFFVAYPQTVKKLERDATRLLRYPGATALSRLLARRAIAKMRVSFDEPALDDAFDVYLSKKNQRASARVLQAFGDTVGHVDSHPFELSAPAAVISRGHAQPDFPWDTEEREAAWRDAHRSLVENLSNAEHVIADQSGHGVPFEQPELVVDTIARVVERARRRHHASAVLAPERGEPR